MASISPKGDLSARAVRAAAAAFASQGVSFGFNFLVAVALARLLSPEDFGVFAIAFAVTGFLEFAKDGGMVVPVIQTETLTSDHLNTLFWFNAGVGAAVTLVACLAAPFVGWFYADPRLVPVTWALAFVFLFGGLSTQHVALLRRQLRFTRLAICEAAALGIASCVAVITAWQGAKYWSLVYFSLTREALRSALLIPATAWIPAWPVRWAAIGPLVRFGGLMMVFDVIGYLNFKLDNLIVAWFAGPAALGFYAKGYQFLLLPVNQINAPLATVVHATLSRLQGEPDRYRSYLTRALLLATSLGMPLTAFLYGNAHTIIGQLLGRQWLPSAPIFQALAPAAFLMTVTTSVGWIFLSLGRGRRQLPWSIFTTAITVSAFFVGVRWGAVGVALAFTMSRVVLFVPTLAYTCHRSQVAWTSLLRTSARPAFASLIALIVGTKIDAMVPTGLWSLPLNLAVFGSVYVLCWVALPGGWYLMRENLLFGRSLYRNA